jgi:hypothetical protein
LNNVYNGVRYRLGSSEEVEDVELSIDGYLSKGLFKGDKFEGTITIGENKLSKLDIRFDKRGTTVLFYYDDKTGDYTAYGTIFTNDMKKEFTITVLEKDSQECAWCESAPRTLASATASPARKGWSNCRTGATGWR